MKMNLASAILFIFVSTCSALDITTRDGTTYKESSVTVETDCLVIAHSQGIARVPYENLPDDLQKKYNFNAAEVAAHRKKIAEAKAAKTDAEQIHVNNQLDSSESIVTPTPVQISDHTSQHPTIGNVFDALGMWITAHWHALPKESVYILYGVLGMLVLAILLRFSKRTTRDQEWKRVCADSDAFFDLLDESGSLPTASTNILLQQGEKAFYSEASSLYETRAVRHYQSGMVGFRVAKDVWVGGSRGRSVSNQELTKLDLGTLTVTSKRIIFRGGRETRTIPIDRVVSVDSLRDAVDVGVSNRQKSMTFGAENPLILASIIRLTCKGCGSIASDSDRGEFDGEAYSPQPPPVEPPPTRKKQRSRSAPKLQALEYDYDIHSRTLGLSGHFSFTDVKRQYYERIKEYHPDKVAALGPKLKELAEAESKKINAAYEFFTERFEANEKA